MDRFNPLHSLPVTLLVWPSKLWIGCGAAAATSKILTAGLPAAASSCLSAVISSLLTCTEMIWFPKDLQEWAVCVWRHCHGHTCGTELYPCCVRRRFAVRKSCDLCHG